MTADVAITRFIEAWGSMGALLGFNPSTVRVHALLIAWDGSLSLDEIAERLQISRGNASMCLKELRSWKVVPRVTKPGERKDFFESEAAVWKMALAIARERKRRDFDPALAGVREALSRIKPVSSGVTGRIRQMEQFLSTLDSFGKAVLDDEAAATSMLNSLRKLLGAPHG
jgi:DNA-binding transcriptional regulator GbsR (MarR family)